MTLKQLATYNLCFNPRTREGATSAFPGENHYQLCFNPRTREGATGGQMILRTPKLGFNPRTREGATRYPRLPRLPRIVSIHAPVRVRRLRLPVSARRTRFQSTHP